MNYDRFFGAGHLPPRPLREDEAAGGRKAVRLHFTVLCRIALRCIASPYICMSFACHRRRYTYVAFTLRSYRVTSPSHLRYVYFTLTWRSHYSYVVLHRQAAQRWQAARLLGPREG